MYLFIYGFFSSSRFFVILFDKVLIRPFSMKDIQYTFSFCLSAPIPLLIMFTYAQDFKDTRCRCRASERHHYPLSLQTSFGSNIEIFSAKLSFNLPENQNKNNVPPYH